MTSSVRATLKGMTDTNFLGPSLTVVRTFYLRFDVFSTRESTDWLDLLIRIIIFPINEISQYHWSGLFLKSLYVIDNMPDL